jgi:signal peptidase
MLQTKNPEFATMLLEIMVRGNYLRSRAIGTSMYPFIRNDDLLLTERKRINDLSIGDVVFFRDGDGTYFMHRLIKKNGPDSVLTKGDNCPLGELVTEEYILGRLIEIERRGRRIRLTGRLSQMLGQISAWFARNYPSHTRFTRHLGRLWWLIKGRRIT